jgi:hypothetical protein
MPRRALQQHRVAAPRAVEVSRERERIGVAGELGQLERGQRALQRLAPQLGASQRTVAVDGTRAPASGMSSLTMPAAASAITMAPPIGRPRRPVSAASARMASTCGGAPSPTPRASTGNSRRSPSSGATITSNASAEPPRRTPINSPPSTGASTVSGVGEAEPQGSRPSNRGAAHRSTSTVRASIASRSSVPRRCRKRATPPDRSTGKRTPARPTARSVIDSGDIEKGASSSMPSVPRLSDSRRLGRASRGGGRLAVPSEAGTRKEAARLDADIVRSSYQWARFHANRRQTKMGPACRPTPSVRALFSSSSYGVGAGPT